MKTHSRKKVIIIVGSQQVGLFISLAQQISEVANVKLVALSQSVEEVLSRHFPISSGVVIKFNPEPVFDKPNLIEEFRRAEASYNFSMAMLCSDDRALGRGYMVNIDNYPNPTRANWGMSDKYREVLKRVRFWENLIYQEAPDLLLSLNVLRLPWLIATKHQIPYLAPAFVKNGDRLFWADCPEYVSEDYVKALKNNLSNATGHKELAELEYRQEVSSAFNHREIKYSLGNAVKKTCYIISKDIYKSIRRGGGKAGYKKFGWVLPTFSQIANYRFVKSRGQKPEDVSVYRIVYFPLQLEPEYSMLSISPEQNNSVECISWISKSLPADAVLVIKEHPFSFAVRSRRFYERLLQIPNVRLADPTVPSWDWVRQASVVATITGTVGVEAVNFKKPVLSFGKSQIINLLPSVEYVTDFSSTQEALKLFLYEDLQSDCIKSKNALLRASLEISFPVPGFEKIRASKNPEPEIAEQLYLGLLKFYYQNVMVGSP